MSAGVPFGDDLAAMDAGAGPDVDDMIGGEDRVLVMFDDDHRIAEIAQPPQRVEQPRIVALMQADRGFVEHVEHAGQARADLRGEADALAFAARQRARGARQRQIVEADIDEEPQPVADLLEDAAGDLVALRRRAVAAASRTSRPRPLTERSETSPICLPVDLDRQRLRLQPRSRGRRRRAPPT